MINLDKIICSILMLGMSSHMVFSESLGNLTAVSTAIAAESESKSSAVKTEKLPDVRSIEFLSSSVKAEIFKVSAANDNDNDAVLNDDDDDVDNDGIPNSVEGDPELDTDSDGTPDFRDTDFAGFIDVNGDGIDDNYDQDLDSLINAYDLDSDNDGIPDAVEANGGTLPANMNSNGQYTIVYAMANDNNTNGLVDDVDPAEGGTALSVPNTDGQTLDDYLDVDSDNDGIPDIIEAGGTDNDNNAIVDNLTDTDGDGLVDVVDVDNSGTALLVPNTDADGDLPDYRDLDSDNDGIPDIVELNESDSDDDGLPAISNLDADGDGWSNLYDNDFTGSITLNFVDIDGDGLYPFQDLDSDNDGISDVIESQGTDVNNDGLPSDTTDTDNDGWPDLFDSDNGGTAYEYPDTDSDDLFDANDLDSDNDGIPDAFEGNGGSVPSNMSDEGQYTTFGDGDGDGYANDVDSNNGGTALSVPNTDGDGRQDYRDLDSDNDGIPDAVEANLGSLPAGMNENGRYATITDTDFDGLEDALDIDNGGTALNNPNTDEFLAGGDALRDYRDLDADADGIVDLIEVDGTDTNNDGRLDDLTDTDNDGLADVVDNNNGGTALTYTNSDSDLLSDFQDTDSDNDNVPDLIEAFDSNSTATTSGGTVDGVAGVTVAGADVDGDGIDNNFEGAIPTFQDTDNKQAVDWRDRDDDGDAIPTIDEIPDVDPANGTPDYLEPTTNPCGSGEAQAYIDAANLSSTLTVLGSLSNAAGPPDGSSAELYEEEDSIIVDFREVLTAGSDRYTVIWKRRSANGNEAFLIISESIDGTNFTQRSLFPSTTDDTEFNITVLTPNINARYISLKKDVTITGNASDIDIDAISSCSLDSDGDILADKDDLDDDNDGIADLLEEIALANDPSEDDDVDGVLNYEDSDIAGYTDSNGDGVNDNFDVDLDGVPNHLDIDSDGDGTFDFIEGFDDNENGDATSDYVLRGENYETANGNPGLYTQADTSASGQPDWLDDTDSDGIPNYLDVDNAAFVDSDNDGLVNLVDTDQSGVSYAGVSGAPDIDEDGDANPYDPTDQQTTLPVTWMDFYGEMIGRNTRLIWKTASEIDNSHFEVQKQQADGSFATIGVVNGNGTKNTLTSYEYIDIEERARTTNYYRLKQIDFDGKHDYSFIIAVSTQNTNSFSGSMTVYPNPITSDAFSVRLTGVGKSQSGDKGDFKVELVSSNGSLRNMDVVNMSNELTLSGTSTLKIVGSQSVPNGVYLILIKDSKYNLLHKERVVVIR